jgi:hypothetical protein
VRKQERGRLAAGGQAALLERAELERASQRERTRQDQAVRRVPGEQLQPDGAGERDGGEGQPERDVGHVERGPRGRWRVVAGADDREHPGHRHRRRQHHRGDHHQPPARERGDHKRPGDAGGHPGDRVRRVGEMPVWHEPQREQDQPGGAGQPPEQPGGVAVGRDRCSHAASLGRPVADALRRAAIRS